MTVIFGPRILYNRTRRWGDAFPAVEFRFSIDIYNNSTVDHITTCSKPYQNQLSRIDMAREKILLTTPRTALLQHSLPSQLKRHLLSKKPSLLPTKVDI